ncbi:hypothetical protein C8R43DRAFT_1132806 [Mycena crocata]|nr:hypothetical protein C8R43DRAFT_1132806 [Mycena crocata]
MSVEENRDSSFTMTKRATTLDTPHQFMQQNEYESVGANAPTNTVSVPPTDNGCFLQYLARSEFTNLLNEDKIVDSDGAPWLPSSSLQTPSREPNALNSVTGPFTDAPPDYANIWYPEIPRSTTPIPRCTTPASMDSFDSMHSLALVTNSSGSTDDSMPELESITPASSESSRNQASSHATDQRYTDLLKGAAALRRIADEISQAVRQWISSHPELEAETIELKREIGDLHRTYSPSSPNDIKRPLPVDLPIDADTDAVDLCDPPCAMCSATKSHPAAVGVLMLVKCFYMHSEGDDYIPNDKLRYRPAQSYMSMQTYSSSDGHEISRHTKETDSDWEDIDDTEEYEFTDGEESSPSPTPVTCTVSTIEGSAPTTHEQPAPGAISEAATSATYTSSFSTANSPIVRNNWPVSRTVLDPTPRLDSQRAMSTIRPLEQISQTSHHPNTVIDTDTNHAMTEARMLPPADTNLQDMLEVELLLKGSNQANATVDDWLRSIIDASAIENTVEISTRDDTSTSTESKGYALNVIDPKYLLLGHPPNDRWTQGIYAQDPPDAQSHDFNNSPIPYLQPYPSSAPEWHKLYPPLEPLSVYPPTNPVRHETTMDAHSMYEESGLFDPIDIAYTLNDAYDPYFPPEYLQKGLFESDLVHQEPGAVNRISIDDGSIYPALGNNFELQEFQTSHNWA